jgi:hypothetical protein
MGGAILAKIFFVGSNSGRIAGGLKFRIVQFELEISCSVFAVAI